MNYLEVYTNAQNELEIKIAQHKAGVKFSAVQMQNIRTAMANMNTAASNLGADYQTSAQQYKTQVGDIEFANQNNPDRCAYLRAQTSPERGHTRRVLKQIPLSSSSTNTFKKKSYEKISQAKALYAYQQFRQQHQLPSISVSETSAQADSVSALISDLSHLSMNQK